VAPANPDAAPLDVPDGITKEPDWQRDPVLLADHGPGILAGVDGADVLAPPPLPTPPAAEAAPVRVGGAIRPPVKLHHVAPVYPPMAQAAKVEGLVIISATIDVEGRVIDATVLSGKPLLNQAAADAVRHWRFTPTLLNGVPVAVVMTVTVNFQLRGL
jgi:protein TonB